MRPFALHAYHALLGTLALYLSILNRSEKQFFRLCCHNRLHGLAHRGESLGDGGTVSLTSGHFHCPKSSQMPVTVLLATRRTDEGVGALQPGCRQQVALMRFDEASCPGCCAR